MRGHNNLNPRQPVASALCHGSPILKKRHHRDIRYLEGSLGILASFCSLAVRISERWFLDFGALQVALCAESVRALARPSRKLLLWTTAGVFGNSHPKADISGLPLLPLGSPQPMAYQSYPATLTTESFCILAVFAQECMSTVDIAILAAFKHTAARQKRFNSSYIVRSYNFSSSPPRGASTSSDSSCRSAKPAACSSCSSVLLLLIAATTHALLSFLPL